MPEQLVTSTELPSVYDIKEAVQVLGNSETFNTELYHPPQTQWLVKLAEFLDWLWSPVKNIGETLYNASPVVYYFVIVILLILLMIFIWHIIKSFKIAFARKTVIQYNPTQKTRALTPDDYIKQANDAGKREDYITAIRLLFRCCLIHLEQGKFRPAVTNRQYIKRHLNTAAEAPLRTFVNLVDYKWYGGRECNKEDWLEAKRASGIIFNYTKSETVSDKH